VLMGALCCQLPVDGRSIEGMQCLAKLWCITHNFGLSQLWLVDGLAG
jgi:hypothetical protein